MVDADFPPNPPGSLLQMASRDSMNDPLRDAEMALLNWKTLS